MKLSGAKIGDNLPGERDVSELEMVPASAAEVVDTAIGAGLAIEEAQIKKIPTIRIQRNSPMLSSPVEYAGTQIYENEMRLMPIDIGCSTIASLFSKLMPYLRRKKNRHVTGASID